MKKGLGKGLGALFSVYEQGEQAADDIINSKPVPRETNKAEPKSEPKPVPRETIDVKKPAEPEAAYYNWAEAQERAGKAAAGVTQNFAGERVEILDLNLIDRNEDQPRKNFDKEALEELAESIRQHGVIQPIVVNNAGGRFVIIAGERRYRASKMAGLKKIPAIIKNYTQRQIKEVALIENLQREDLNSLEAARAIKRLMEEHGMNQEEVADRIGKSRPAIANTLRLLSLQPEVQAMLEKGKLSAGHARTLVVVSKPEDQIRLARLATDDKKSVRDLEKIVREYLNPSLAKPKAKQSVSLELKELISDMQKIFATKVHVLGGDRRGRIYIDYYSKEDLDRISDCMERLKRR
ncbi:MAG: ParB/RepB/Spo0J family partition protein [Firmicutes bacterium]|nr:ParB/RepB/Spo0J family partition protein [Bacillota bacterium]